MTNTNQQTGGVARQLLQRIDNRVYGALPHSADRIDGQRQGATEMHAMLSAEARAIIAEHDEQSRETEWRLRQLETRLDDPFPPSINEEYKHLRRLRTHDQKQRELIAGHFRRLGLAIDHDETEGE